MVLLLLEGLGLGNLGLEEVVLVVVGVVILLVSGFNLALCLLSLGSVDSRPRKSHMA
jgi:hypothetical protein